MALNIKQPQEQKSTSNGNVFSMVQKQLEREFHVEKTYLSIAVWAQNEGLVEMGKFFYARANEEREHAIRHINLLLECDKLPIIPHSLEPFEDITCIDCALDHTYFTERQFTGYFKDMYDAAKEEDEGRVMHFAETFLAEQLEEEKWSLSLRKLWKTCDGSKIDFEMAIKDFASNQDHHLGL